MVRVVCLVQLAPDRISFSWSHGPDSFPTFALTGQTADLFRERVVAVRERLHDLVGVYLEDINNPASPKGGSESMRLASLALAQAGYELRQRAFKPNEDPGKAAKDVAKWLDQLHSRGAIECMEIISEGSPPVPWTLLYETKPDEAAFRAGGENQEYWRGFWGLRYTLSGGQRVDPRRRMPWWETPKVVMVVDPLVRQGLPGDVQTRLDAFATGRGLKIVGSRSELEEALSDGRPDLLYWLGHASPDALILGDGPGSEVRPSDLLELLEGDGDGLPGGLVFLNACRTAEASPTAGSFVRAVFDLRMGGLIATEQQTVDTFAAPLGLDFLEAFLDRGESVGTVMHRLRGRVPLGLVYGTYCPPEIRVAKPDQPRSTPDILIDSTAPERGVALGATATAPRRAIAPVRIENREWPPLPSHPYRSLQSYGPEHRALFAGRDQDALRFARVLDDPNTRLVILHGESGVGKTSFLRAGLIPYLEDECIGYRFARDFSREGADPVLFIRATNDLTGQLAACLYRYCCCPITYRTPAGESVTVELLDVLRSANCADQDSLRDAMRADPGLLGELLAKLASMFPFTPVVVIDQAEEVFTLARTEDDERNRVQGLELLRRAASIRGRFKIIVSLRTEYHGRLVDRLRKSGRDEGIREYLLTDFGADALADAIRRPTSPIQISYSSEVPFQKYRFAYAEGVPEEIARQVLEHTTNRSDSVLPLVQVICGQLYEQVRERPDPVIRAEDLAANGGVGGGMKRHVEGLVTLLFHRPADRRAFRILLTSLFLRQPDGTLTTALVPSAVLEPLWQGRMPFRELLTTAGSGEKRLLRLSELRVGGVECEHVSLGHDALAKVAARWQDELERWKRMRKLVRLAVAAGIVAVLSLGAGWWAMTLKERADKATDQAKSERELADVARNEAIKQKNDADAAKKAAEDAKTVAVDLRDQAERSDYISSIRHADTGWDNGDFGESVKLLEKYHPDARGVRRNRIGDEPPFRRGFEWNVLWRQTGQIRPGVKHDGTQVRSVAWSPDGKSVATGSLDGTIRLWDATDPMKLPIMLPKQPETVWSVAWSKNGLLATASANGLVHVWNPANPTPLVHEFRVSSKTPLWLMAVAWSADGKFLAVGTDEGIVQVWDVGTNKVDCVRTFKSKNQPWTAVWSLAWSSDGRLAAGHVDGYARVWDAAADAEANPHTVSVYHSKSAFEVSFISVAWSPDSALFTAGSDDGAVRLWKATALDDGPIEAVPPEALWAEESPSRDAKLPIRSVSWSPDGESLAAGSIDGTTKVWHRKDATHDTVFHGHAGAVVSSSWSPDGKAIVTGSTDGTARFWNTQSPRNPAYIQHPESEPWVSAYSPDGFNIATGFPDGTARISRVNTLLHGTDSVTLLSHAGPIRSIACSRSGGYVATGSDDQIVRIWDLQSGKLLWKLPGHTGTVESLAWSQGPKEEIPQLATGTTDGTARIWTLPRSQNQPAVKSLEIPCKGGTIWSLAWSGSGAFLLTGSENGSAAVWDLGDGRLEAELVKSGPPIRSVGWSTVSNSDKLAVGTDDGTVRTWEWDDDKMKPVPKSGASVPDGRIRQLAWSPDGAMLGLGMLDGSVWVWDSRRLQDAPRELGGHISQGAICGIAWRDLRVLRAVSDAGKANEWSIDEPEKEAKERRRVDWVEPKVQAVAWSPDGKFLATGSLAGVLQVWDAERNAPLASKMIGHGAIWTVAWSPDGQFVSTGSEAGHIRIWAAADLRLVHEIPPEAPLKKEMRFKVFGSDLFLGFMPGQEAPARSVEWSKDGKYFAAAYEDGNVRVWDWNSRTIVARLKRQPREGGDLKASSLSWSKDGRLAIGFDKGYLGIWNPVASPDGDPTLLFRAHLQAIWAVAWSPEGRVATAAEDLTVRIWDVADKTERGELVVQLAGHTRGVIAMSWSHDGMYLATTSLDHTVRVWGDPSPRSRPEHYQALFSFKSAHAAQSVAWSPDGARLAVGWQDGITRIWDGRAP